MGKNIIYFMLLFVDVCPAQTPSSSDKEQYAQFITSYFAASKLESGWYKQRGINKRREVTKQELQFLENNSKMIFYSEHISSSLESDQLKLSCFKRKFVIDFKKIENISVFRKSLNGEKYEISLFFKARGNTIRAFTIDTENVAKIQQCEDAVLPSNASFTNTAEIVIKYSTIDKEGNMPYDNRILDAFEQLIKLNGAPIPANKCFEIVLSTKTN